MSSPDTTPELLTKLATVVWGAYGTNGLNKTVQDHGRQIGDLYGRDETTRTEVAKQIGEVENRLNDKLDGLYKLVATLMITVLIGAGSIIATLLVVK